MRRRRIGLKKIAENLRFSPLPNNQKYPLHPIVMPQAELQYPDQVDDIMEKFKLLFSTMPLAAFINRTAIAMVSQEEDGTGRGRGRKRSTAKNKCFVRGALAKALLC